MSHSAADQWLDDLARAREYAEMKKNVEQLCEFRDWVETWVDCPATTYSVAALDGLFKMARDKIARTRDSEL